MAARPPALLTFLVSFDDCELDLDITADKSVGELIRLALSAYGIHEDYDSCHLERGGRQYWAFQDLRDVGLENEASLTLRLPI